MEKRGKHAIAVLDRKTQSLVRCGSCGRELAQVEVVLGHRDLSRVRVLYLSFAWRRDEAGIYRLPARAARLARDKGLSYAWPRRGRRLVTKLMTTASVPLVVKKSGFGANHLDTDPDPEGIDVVETSQLLEAGPELPIEMECYNCHTIQLLTAENLGVEETLVGDAPYDEVAEQLGLHRVDNRQLAVIVRSPRRPERKA